jgi:hypothetical protein
MKWIEVSDEENWDKVRQIFEPLAAKLRSAGLDAAVMIRRGNPADEIIDEAESWGADCIFVERKESEELSACCLEVCPQQCRHALIAQLKS